PPPPGAPWTSFLERCLIDLVPSLLPAIPADERLPLLVQLWNLGEGLRAEPDWVDRYVNACAGRLRSLADVGPFLVAAPGPAITPSPAPASSLRVPSTRNACGSWRPPDARHLPRCHRSAPGRRRRLAEGAGALVALPPVARARR